MTGSGLTPCLRKNSTKKFRYASCWHIGIFIFYYGSIIHFESKSASPLVFYRFAKVFMHPKSCPAARVSPSERIEEPLDSASQGYYSTTLLTQEVSQHIALYDAQLHGTFSDSSLRVPVKGNRRERCVARFPKFLSGLNEPVPLFLFLAEAYDVASDHHFFVRRDQQYFNF